MAVRLESYETHTAPRANTGAEQIGRAVQSLGEDIGRGITAYGRQQDADKKERLAEELGNAQDASKQYQNEQKLAQEQQEARDRIMAADRLGGVQRAYTRRVSELEKTFIGSKTSPEFEKQKKQIFDELLGGSVGGVADKVSQEMQKSGKTWINAQLLSDLEKSMKEEAAAAEAAAGSYAANAIGTGATLGENGDIAQAQIAYGLTRNELKNFADKMSENSDIPMKEFDANYMLSFLTGAAKGGNPELAWDMSKPENLANFMGRDYEKDQGYFDTLSKNLRQYLEKPIEYGKNLLAKEEQQEINQAKTTEALDFMNNPVIMGARLETINQKNKFGDVSTFKDFYDMHKGRYDEPANEEDAKFRAIYEKERNQTFETNELTPQELMAYNEWKKNGGGKGLTDLVNDLGLEEDAVGLAFDRVDTLIKAGASEEDALQSVFEEFSTGRIKVDASGNDFKNVRKIDLLKNITPEEAEEYIKNGTSKTDIIRAQAEKLYMNSGQVGDGSITNAELHNVMKQVANITIDENGDVDNNLIKAFMARNYIQDHNGSPEQIATFNKVVEKALTDRNFKDGIAKLANRTSFDDLFAKTHGTSKVSGIAGFVRSRQDDMNDYVQNVGRDAYLGAMAFLAAGQPEEAMRYYDQKVRQAYDFVKSDVIDTTMVNAVLAAGGKPIVPVNGQMSEIVGRDNNGEYILRNTGRTVNGTF